MQGRNEEVPDRPRDDLDGVGGFHLAGEVDAEEAEVNAATEEDEALELLAVDKVD